MCPKDSNPRTLPKEEYPATLASSKFMPREIFIKGELPRKAAFIAMVGTRRPSSGAEDRCNALVKSLRGTNAAVVSGLAQGIDSFCHKAALDNGIPTIAVLAQGLGTHIGGSREFLAREILEAGGALLSEYPGETPPYKSSFPARNRIIEGLSQVTTVVESKSEGGALITAGFCIEEKRPLFAVPGDWDRETATGPLELLRTGKAKPIWNPLDFADLCGAVRKSDLTLADFSKTAPGLSESAEKLISRNTGFTCSIAELQQSTGLALPALLAILTELEMAGLAHSKDGNSFHFSALE